MKVLDVRKSAKLQFSLINKGKCTLPLLVFLLTICLFQPAMAQFGGRYIFKFVNLPVSARIASLGGQHIAVADDDINLAYGNPSLLNPQMHQQISFNHSFHFDGIQHGFASYGHYAEKIATTFYAGFQYVNYGDFELTDEFFQVLGTFRPREVAATIGAARMIDERISFGVNLRYMTSQFEAYNASALGFDAGLTYLDTANNFTAAVVLKNAGTVLSSYTEQNTNEELPLEIQIGISKRLRYLPFRFSVIYHNLQQWTLLFDDPNLQETSIFIGDGNSTGQQSEFLQNLFRHLTFNGELLIGKRENLRFRLGYNNFLRQDLTNDDFGSLAGFSFGLGIKVNRFRIEYGHLVYHVAGGVNHLSISTNINEFK